MKRNTRKTFLWMVGILNKHRVPFVIVGGLAARIYGSPRPLNDIDIDIPVKCFDLILDDVRPYITYGPAHYVDERWDMQLITLNHEGQLIDLGGADTIKICDARTGKWHSVPSETHNVERKDVFGVVAPIIPKKDLVKYKSMLAGEHQQIDIKTIFGSRE